MLLKSNKASKLVKNSMYTKNLLNVVFERECTHFGVHYGDGEMGVVFSEVASFEQKVIVEQLMRFSEVMTYKEVITLDFRELENFLRDENAVPCISPINFKKVEEEFTSIKNLLKPVFIFKKGFELQQKTLPSIEDIDFITSCKKLNELFDAIDREFILNQPKFYQIQEWLIPNGELIFKINPDITVEDYEMEFLRFIGLNIKGVNSLKMVV